MVKNCEICGEALNKGATMPHHLDCYINATKDDDRLKLEGDPDTVID